MSVVTIYEDDEMRVRADPRDWTRTLVVEKPVRGQDGHAWEMVHGVQRVEFTMHVRRRPVVTIVRHGQMRAGQV